MGRLLAEMAAPLSNGCRPGSEEEEGGESAARQMEASSSLLGKVLRFRAPACPRSATSNATSGAGRAISTQTPPALRGSGPTSHRANASPVIVTDFPVEPETEPPFPPPPPPPPLGSAPLAEEAGVEEPGGVVPVGTGLAVASPDQRSLFDESLALTITSPGLQIPQRSAGDPALTPRTSTPFRFIARQARRFAEEVEEDEEEEEEVPEFSGNPLSILTWTGRTPRRRPYLR